MKEVFRFDQAADGWDVLADPNRTEPVGFNAPKRGFQSMGTWGAIQVPRKFDRIPVEDGLVPPDIRPKDVVDAIFGVRQVPGLDVEPGVLDAVIKVGARLIFHHFSKIDYDYIFPMASSKAISKKLAAELSTHAGRRVIDGLIKQKDPNKVTLDPEAGKDNPEFRRDLEDSLAQYRRNMAKGAVKIRKSAKPQFRRHFRGMYDLGDAGYDAAEKHAQKHGADTRPRVLIVDDSIMEGNSMRDAHQAISPLFDVVGMAAIFIADKSSSRGR